MEEPSSPHNTTQTSASTIMTTLESTEMNEPEDDLMTAEAIISLKEQQRQPINGGQEDNLSTTRAVMTSPILMRESSALTFSERYAQHLPLCMHCALSPADVMMLPCLHVTTCTACALTVHRESCGSCEANVSSIARLTHF
eukprot:TRINITY_DN27397_c0_g1_i1.p1 TRINITY_DN27397_c0_g1~~TRINITY_DN27397_c0_g1_i1.p1  ORF type:complete len:165 (+),score=28.96 TRINITY_DN27397_c0_g1_i1:75-497(+)